MFTTDANLKAENEELKKELLKTKNNVRKLNEKCESYEDRLQGFVQDRAQLLDSLHVLESMKLEIKQFDIEQMQINEDRLKHRVEVTKNLLDENRARVEELEAELKNTQDDLAELQEEHKNTVLKNNQEIYTLKSRLDIAYTKLAESQYVINEFDNLGFWARLRNKKPEDLEEVYISKSALIESADEELQSLKAGETSIDSDLDSVDADLDSGDDLDSVDGDLNSGDGDLDSGDDLDSVDGDLNSDDNLESSKGDLDSVDGDLDSGDDLDSVDADLKSTEL